MPVDIRSALREQMKLRGMEWWELAYKPEQVARVKEYWDRCDRLNADSSLMRYKRLRLLRPKQTGVPRWARGGRGYPGFGPEFRFFEKHGSVHLNQLAGMIRRVGLRLDPPAASIFDGINSQMRTLGVSRYGLAKALQGKVPKRTIFHFLSGDGHLINVEALGQIFDALGITLKPAFT